MKFKPAWSWLLLHSFSLSGRFWQRWGKKIDSGFFTDSKIAFLPCSEVYIFSRPDCSKVAYSYYAEWKWPFVFLLCLLFSVSHLILRQISHCKQVTPIFYSGLLSTALICHLWTLKLWETNKREAKGLGRKFKGMKQIEMKLANKEVTGYWSEVLKDSHAILWKIPSHAILWKTACTFPLIYPQQNSFRFFKNIKAGNLGREGVFLCGGCPYASWSYRSMTRYGESLSSFIILIKAFFRNWGTVARFHVATSRGKVARSRLGRFWRCGGRARGGQEPQWGILP